MKEIIKKLIDAGKTDALNSLEEFRKAATEMGYTGEQIEEALEGFGGFPLDDDDLEEIAGGSPYHHPSFNKNTTEIWW
ncbi:MAG: hypothetical protein K6G42_00095 [Lachnospiraceae bacterium]|nr:hypothetical protein [Lachnospiraceae bacterium]